MAEADPDVSITEKQARVAASIFLSLQVHVG